VLPKILRGPQGRCRARRRGQGRTAVTLGRSLAAKKPARQTPGRWGSVCGTRAWTGETNGARGKKKIDRRPVARF
jgi:hypothetical protein